MRGLAQLGVKDQVLGQCLCNSKAVLFPLLGAFQCLPEEPDAQPPQGGAGLGSAHCVLSF